MIKNKFISGSIAAIAAAVGITLCGFSANATTIDDVAAAARAKGIPEYVIQAGYNNYNQNPGSYSSNDFDNAIVCLDLYKDNLDKAIDEYFGVTETEIQTTAAAPTENTSTQTTTISPANEEKIISQAEFIKMTLEEKLAFVNKLSDSEKAKFLNGLSNEERNSILKQLSTEQKIDILSNFIDAGNSMGLNFQIEDINNDSLSMSIRNENGDLIDVSGIGSTVEDTGYDYRLFAKIAGIIVSASLLEYLYAASRYAEIILLKFTIWSTVASFPIKIISASSLPVSVSSTA